MSGARVGASRTPETGIRGRPCGPLTVWARPVSPRTTERHTLTRRNRAQTGASVRTLQRPLPPVETRRTQPDARHRHAKPDVNRGGSESVFTRIVKPQTRVKNGGLFVRGGRIIDMSPASDLTGAVVRAVAEHEEVPPSELPSLEDDVDAETFEQLTNAGARSTNGLEFSYLWYQIEVKAGRIVAIDP